jgi:hypothetical protein
MYVAGVSATTFFGDGSKLSNLNASSYAPLSGAVFAGDVTLDTSTTYSITQLGSDIIGEAFLDQSGYSVSMNAAGDRVAIGARYNDGSGLYQCGHVRIYSWDGSVWTKLGSDLDGEAIDDNFGASVSMNAAGDRVAIGAIGNDGSGSNAGRVRIYSWNGSAWTQLGANIDGEAIADEAGYSISMNAAGDRVAIGARYNDGSGSNAGHVRIYSWDGSVWTKLGSNINGEAADDYSGVSISMNAAGDRVAIGAPNNDGSGLNAGHVRIYSWNGSAWTQLGSDIDGEAAGDISGNSVSMNTAGDRVAIGARYNDGSGTDMGHVRVYSWNGSTWTQLGPDIDPIPLVDLPDYGDFGVSVSLNAAGDILAVGDPALERVILYYWNGIIWNQIGANISTGLGSESFGQSVSLNAKGDKLVIGAPTSSFGGSNVQGGARVYSIFFPPHLAGNTATFTGSVSAPIIRGTFVGDGSNLTGITSNTSIVNKITQLTTRTASLSSRITNCNLLATSYYFRPGSYTWVCPEGITEVAIVLGSGGGGAGSAGAAGGNTICSIGNVTVSATGGGGSTSNTGGNGGTVAAVPPDPSKGFSGVSLGAGGIGGGGSSNSGGGGSSYGGAAAAANTVGNTGSSFGGSRGGGGGGGSFSTGVGNGGSSSGYGGAASGGGAKQPGILPETFSFFSDPYNGREHTALHAQGATPIAGAAGGGAGAIAAYSVFTVPGSAYTFTVGLSGANGGSSVPTVPSNFAGNGFLYIYHN